MKKQSNLSRLMGYAGGHKILTYLSWVLSVMSALLALVPFWYIWRIIHDILEVSPDFSKVGNVTSYGLMLSRLVDTFFSRTSWTMLLYAGNHSISVA